MGREIKRVPVDFDWPQNKVWEGFLSPDTLRGVDCPECEGGQTAAGWWLQTLCQRIGMLAQDVGEQQRGRAMHPWLTEDPYPAMTRGKYDPDTRRYIEQPRIMRPSEDMAALVAGLDGTTVDRVTEPLGVGGHGMWKALVNAAGVGDDWGSCKACDGEGTTEAYPGQRADADAWEPSEPPAGDGWQVWETVSEGSPISPVFPDAEGLAQWLTTPESCWGATRRPMTIEQARGFVGAGWAPTGFINGGGMHDGAEYVGTAEALRGHDL